MACKALAPVVAKAYGKGSEGSLSDAGLYLWPLGLQFLHRGREAVWLDSGNQQVVPLGTSDFSSALLNIANSGAQVFVNIAFGADAVASTKQADQFGVLKKMKLIVPNISSFQAKQVGASLMQGVYGTFDFWWTLQDRYPLAKDFVQAFLKQHNYHPRWGAHIAYMQTMIWAVAVERAKTFYPPEVIKTLEASKSDPYESSLGKVYYRAERSPARPAGACRGGQGSVGDEERGRFLRRGRGGARRAGDAAARGDRLPHGRLYLTRRTDPADHAQPAAAAVPGLQRPGPGVAAGAGQQRPDHHPRHARRAELRARRSVHAGCLRDLRGDAGHRFVHPGRSGRLRLHAGGRRA